MEELLAYALLLHEEIIVTEALYLERLDQLFLETPEDAFLLALECETDTGKAVRLLQGYANCWELDWERFGRTLMGLLREYYNACPDIREFAGKTSLLWNGLPWRVQREEPFWTLSFAGDPLSWGDEAQSRALYETMLAYYCELPPEMEKRP